MWGMIVAVVAIACFAGIIEKKIKAHKEVALARANSSTGSEEVMIRLEQMEDRIANLETLVLEREKRARFDDALRENTRVS